MKHRSNNKLTQEASAAKAGISARTARSIDHGNHYTQLSKENRDYKTRKSPVDEIWDTELVQMLENNPCLQPSTLFIHLERTYIDGNGDPIYAKSCLRTLQRKVANWKAMHGPSKDIIIPQNHIPGQQALSDFTHMNSLNITINGQAFIHMLYHFRLVYSKWSHVKIIQGGESFQALSEGLQEALLCLGGSPKEHRTDSLAAAYKNRNGESKADLTDSYKEFCDYYNMEPTRNNKGISHENGSVESAHGHLKNRIKQELFLRNSNDFDSVASYDKWLQDIVLASNRRNSKNVSLEKQALQPLPIHKTMDYELISTNISNLSMMVARNMTYSVPSRLAGHTITLHLYQSHIEGYLGSSQVFDLQRKYQHEQPTRYIVDYRHIIHAFIKKPRAFRMCKYRDELLPNKAYQEIWQYLDATESKEVAPKLMLRLLKLAADYDCESEIEKIVCALIGKKKPINIQKIEQEFNLSNPKIPEVSCLQHNLNQYDQHIPTGSIAIGASNYATV